jgi:hypothetical protein
MYGTWVPASIKIARDSSTCFGYFTRDMDTKLHLLKNTVANFDDISECLFTGNFVELWDKYRWLNCYYLGYRAQPDKVSVKNGKFISKDRWINDAVYAATEGRKGEHWIADKSVYIHGHKIDGHFAARRRVVYGISGCVNYFLNGIMSGHREHYLKRYAFTWKHTTREAILAKLNTFKYWFGSDVTSYDTTIAQWMFDFLNRERYRYWDERIVELVRLCYNAPYFMPDPVPGGGSGPLWMGNPLQPSTYHLKMGLPSGVPMNPDDGKLFRTAAELCMLDDYFGDVLEFGIDRILQGQHPLYGFLNMGDDNLAGTNDKHYYETQMRRMEAGENISPYFKIEKEKVVTFLGNVVYRNHYDELCLSPNLVSFLVNKFVPEASTTSMRRKYWPIGFAEAPIFYSAAPAFSAVWSALVETFKEIFHIDFEGYIAAANEEIGSPDSHLTSIDRMVLDDPLKMNYRFTEDDVSSEILDLVVTKVPADFSERYLSRFIK